MTVFGKVMVMRCKECGVVSGMPHKLSPHIGTCLYYPNWEDSSESEGDLEFARRVDAVLAPAPEQNPEPMAKVYKSWPSPAPSFPYQDAVHAKLAEANFARLVRPRLRMALYDHWGLPVAPVVRKSWWRRLLSVMIHPHVSVAP